MNFSLIFVLLTTSLTSLTSAQFGSIKLLRRVHNQCSSKDEIVKCWKIQALKAIDRALHWKSLQIIEGVSLVNNERIGRNLPVLMNDTKLEKLDTDQIDHLLIDRTSRFLDNHRMRVEIPRLIEEGRKKNKGSGGMGGALLGALAIKGSFLAMAYKGIAMMSGMALIVGKMALMLAAILGLKKLVSGNEKTTFEIVKVPKYYEQNTHSTSYEDDGYHHHHRSLNVAGSTTNSNPYRGYIPKV